MKALVYTASKKVEIRDVPAPAPRDGAVKVKMQYCGVCGSDIGIYIGKHPRAKPPLILGHEFVGIVEENRGKGLFKPGDRVVAYPLLSCGECQACRTGTPHVCKTLHLLGIDVDGGMADHAWVDEDVLFKVGDDVSDQVAALVEPLAVIVRSMHQAQFKLLDSAIVLGAGPIGVLTAIVLKHSGASRIIITDIDNARLELCKQFGFETVNTSTNSAIDYVNDTTNGNGVDIVFECSGAAQAALEMSKMARIGGMLCLTGIHKDPHPVNLLDMNFKEQILIGTRVYTKREFEQTVAYVSQIKDDLAKTITQVVPLTEADKVFDMIADPSLATLKVLVDCTR